MQGDEGRFVRAKEALRADGRVLGAWLQEGARIAWLVDGRGLVLASLAAPAADPPRLIAPASAFPAPPLRVAVSGDGAAVAVVRSPQTVDVIRAADGASAAHVRKTGKVLGVHWALPGVLLVVSDQALQLVEWDAARPALKLQREQRVSVVCYRYDSRVLVAGLGGTLVAAYVVKRGARIEALGRATVDTRAGRPLLPSECHLVQLYHRLYFVYVDAPHAQLLLFQLTTTDMALKKRLSLFLPAAVGRVFLSVADNLLLVHHTEGRITSVFDIKDAPQAAALSPLAGPLPLFLDAPAAAPAEAYAADWEYCDGAHVLAGGGAQVLSLHVAFEALSEALAEPDRRVAFLLRRRNSRAALAAYLRLLLMRRTPLTALGAIWDLLNSFLDPPKPAPPAPATPAALPAPAPAPSAVLPLSGMSSSLSSGNLAALGGAPFSPSALLTAAPGAAGAGRAEGDERRTSEGVLQLDQEELYRLVLVPVDDAAPADDAWPAYLVGALVEYVRSLNFAALPVAHYIHELLISLLVRHRRLAQLHHLLQYHVIADSLHVACQLLSLEAGYAPAAQLALDMLKRLASPEQIAEVLLSRHDVLAALRVLRANPSAVRISPLRFLDAAEHRLVARADSTLYHSVYAHFFPAVLRQPDAPPAIPPKATPEERAEYLRHAGIFRSLFGATP